MTRKTNQQYLDEALYEYEQPPGTYKNTFRPWRTMIENLFIVVQRHERELAKLRSTNGVG